MSSSEPLVYLSGDLVPASQAGLKIYDAGIILGATVTDLIRTFRKQPYRLEDHVARFYRSCKYAQILPRISPEETVAVSRRLLEHNGALLDARAELALVFFITPGVFPVYAGSAGFAGEGAPTHCMHTFPLPFPLWRGYFTDGAHAVTPSIRHIPPQCTDPKMKCRSRMHWWLADRESHLVDPKAVSLLLDLNGNVTETSGSNFLIVREGRVISPPPGNILPGVSLATVRELCGELGIPFVEQDLQVHDVINADEAFLVTTPYCMAPVTRINGISIGDGRPMGPMFRRLIGAWSGRVGVDIVAQVMGEGN
jgi:branched-subunit amino acid aminotransferase/4-amino-4-deoxychorismate lyase